MAADAWLGAAYDVALLDLDGVVYIGGTAIPGAPEALHKAKQSGMRLGYVTNNASRTPAAVLLADKLPANANVLVIGSTALRLAVRERGLNPVSTATEKPLAVVQGYGP